MLNTNPAARFAAMVAYARLATFGFPANLADGVMAYRADADQKVRDIARTLTTDPVDAFALAIHIAAWASGKPPATTPTALQIAALEIELGLR